MELTGTDDGDIKQIFIDTAYEDVNRTEVIRNVNKESFFHHDYEKLGLCKKREFFHYLNIY